MSDKTLAQRLKAHARQHAELAESIAADPEQRGYAADLRDAIVLLAERDALAAERDALRADAERYRWLRDTNPHGEIVFDHSVPDGCVFKLHVPFDGEPIEDDAEMARRLNASIDTARGAA